MPIYDDIRMFTNYDESIETYGYTVQTEWDYTQSDRTKVM